MDNVLARLAYIVQTPFIVAYIASLCDKRYCEVTGNLDWHNPESFRAPFDMKKAEAIGKNSAGLFAVVTWVQTVAMMRGATTRGQIGKKIVDVLAEIIAIPDPRARFTKQELERTPLNIADAIDLFGEHIGALALANGEWNLSQWLLMDKGPLGRATRSNIFADLSLATLLLDWDQVVVVANYLHEFLSDKEPGRTTQIMKIIKTE